MYSVTFNSPDKKRRKKYQSEPRALKSIWQWLQQNQGSAMLFAPGHEPRIYNHWQDVPYTPSKVTNFANSPGWLRIRLEAFDRYGNKCCCCGATPESGAVLHVDHIKPKSKHPELALDINNLQILCSECNIGKSNHSQSQWRS